MARTAKKSNKQEFICFYVCNDGRPKTLMKSLVAERISDAASMVEGFIGGMIKKAGKGFDSKTIASLTIMPKPDKSRKSRKSK